MSELLFLGFLGLIGVLVTLLIIMSFINHKKDVRPYPIRPSKQIIGGCAGTQHGCCADGRTAKSDRVGSNCLLY